MQPQLPIPPLDTKQTSQQSLLRTPGTVYTLGYCIGFPGNRKL